MEFTQAMRRIAIDTPLGRDELLLTSLDGVEQMSRLFAYRLRMLSENEAIDPREIVGQNVTITLMDVDDEPRYLNGYVRNFVNQGRGDRATLYTAEIVPWLWFLTRRSDCRIFQDKTIPQIIELVFRGLGFADCDLSGLTAVYEKREYTVQYRETDFDFVSRLMEHEGIFYFFRHEDGRHVLVLGDSVGVNSPCKHNQVRFAGPLSFSEVDDDLTAWEHRFEYRSGRVSFADFNFETPETPVCSRDRTLLHLSQNERYELYDYPGDFSERDGGDRRTRMRMQEEEAPHDLVVGGSKCRSFGPGSTFTLAAHHQPQEKGQTYLITAVRHKATAGDYVTGAGQQPESYHNEFECIPAGVHYRPLRMTPRALVRGPQTAIVVGPSGDEIYTDEYGRVKVQFHWDRYGQNDENSSCWIRVSQAWAGDGFGAIAIPRIGQEVIVEFLEGDPDRPLITGRVYNAKQMQPDKLPQSEMAGPDGPKPIKAMQNRPAGLPDAKTRTSFKSNSSPGGGSGNEIAFDDANGSQLLHINASKDAVITVADNEVTSVGNVQEVSVGADQIVYVGANAQETVAAAKVIDVGTTLLIKAGTSITLQCGAATIHMNQAGVISISGTMLNISGSIIANLAAPITNVSGALALTNSGAINLSMGAFSLVEGAMKLMCHGGTSEYAAKSDCVVKGAMVKLN